MEKANFKRIELANAEPIESARISGLRYVTDQIPGIRRMRSGKAFRYFDSNGKPVRDADEIRRIQALAIPPAWKGVWISPFANSHLQATGRDAKGRKQYRYHRRWREDRDQNKYDRMILLGQKLPALRDRVAQDLALKGLPRIKVIAAIVQLLESTLIRIGNEEYARQNHSFGLTTMRSQHVKVEGSRIRFRFRGKSGVGCELDLNDRRLAEIVKRCRDLPGQELFQYVDEDGELRAVDSGDVNDYLREVTGEDFTAKDFRTWAGTVLAVKALWDSKRVASMSEAKRNVVRALDAVARKLGNTRAVCQRSYIHPVVLASYLNGSLARHLDRCLRRALSRRMSNLHPEEAAVISLLQKQWTRTLEKDLADSLKAKSKRKAA